MLIRYKKSQEKIAMGLLSFMPIDKDVKLLQQTIKEYDENPDWHLYLWKEEEDIVGAIGLKIENNFNVIIQHLSVNPSFRNMGIGRKMVDEVQTLYGKKYDIGGNEATERFFDKCTNEQKNDQVN